MADDNNKKAANMMDIENNKNADNRQSQQEQKYALTENAGFEELIDQDKTTEIVGYVEEITAAKSVGKNNQFRLFKFVLGNGEKKVSCCIWDKESIAKYEPEVKINRVIHIIGGVTKSQKLKFVKNASEGHVPFEIIIQPSTTIEYLGYHNLQLQETAELPVEVTFENIADNTSGYIKISGHLKQAFRLIENHYGPTSSYASSAITDAKIKVNLEVTNYNPTEEIAVGTFITVTGIVTQSGQLITITCKDMSAITPDFTKPTLTKEECLKARQFPKRKSMS